MDVAKTLARRSHDPSTKHGAVIVDSRNIVIGAGYNGFPRGVDESHFPDTRPEKYRYVIHAEANALLHCHGDARGATMYVTGIPCSRCMGEIIQKGITRVVCGDTQSALVDSEEVSATSHIAWVCGVKLEMF